MKALALIILFSLSFLITKAQDKNSNQGKDTSNYALEHPPEYPGGVTAFVNYLGTHVHYPKNAQKNIQGRVIVSFVIDTKGKPDSVVVVNSLSPEFDNEAVKAINGMPKWRPGVKNGKPVRVSYTVPISFSGPLVAKPDSTKKS